MKVLPKYLVLFIEFSILRDEFLLRQSRVYVTGQGAHSAASLSCSYSSSDP
jgi:hypothetical protein